MGQGDRARVARRRAARHYAPASGTTRTAASGTTRLGEHHCMPAAFQRKRQCGAHRPAARNQYVRRFSVHDNKRYRTPQSLPTRASMAATLFGVAAVITSQPSAVTSTSSSMRTPMFQ